MIVMTNAEFLMMPPGTVFQKYEPITVGELCVKGDTVNDIDFWFTPLTTSFDMYGTENFLSLIGDASPKFIPMEFDEEVRDGMFADGQLFAVWTREDVEGLVSVLSRCVL